MLQEDGFVVGRDKVRTLMRRMGIEALEEALARFGKPLIFNTDQGSQFTSEGFIGVLLAHRIEISMDGKGAWRDNVFVERLWRLIKYEEIVCCGSLASLRGQTKLYRRWRTALRCRPAGADTKPPQAARVKSPGGERWGKRREIFRQVGLWCAEQFDCSPLMDRDFPGGCHGR